MLTTCCPDGKLDSEWCEQQAALLAKKSNFLKCLRDNGTKRIANHIERLDEELRELYRQNQKKKSRRQAKFFGLLSTKKASFRDLIISEPGSVNNEITCGSHSKFESSPSVIDVEALNGCSGAQHFSYSYLEQIERIIENE